MKLYFAIALLCMSSISHSQQIHLYSNNSAGRLVSKYIKDIDLEFHSATSDRLLVKNAEDEENSMIIMTYTGHIIDGVLNKKYEDPTKNFDAFALLNYAPVVVGIKYDSPYDTLEKLAFLANQKNRPLLLGGTRSKWDLCGQIGEFISRKYGVPVTFVLYTNSAYSSADVLMNRIDMKCAFGHHILDEFVTTKQFKIVGNFSRFTDDLLKNYEPELPIDNAQFVLVNKKMKLEVRQKIKNALTSKSFKDSTLSLEKTSFNYFRVSFDETDLLKEKELILKLIGK